MRPAKVQAAEAIARAEAAHMRFLCAVIRMGVHDSTHVLDRTIRRLEDTARNRGTPSPVRRHLPLSRGTTRRGAPTTKIEVDPHLTVYLGRDWDHCQVEGHIFVLLDPPTGVPVRKMRPVDRRFVQPGHEPCSAEYWRYS